MIGKVIEKYEIKSEIGRGGMGIVYRGHQTNLGRDVAIKVLPPQLASDKQSVDRFIHEANLVAKLNHENIVQIYDILEEEGAYFIIMEFLDGHPMDQIIRKKTMDLTREELLQCIMKVCAALEATHQKGIVHRDVKCANIFVTHDHRVKLMDFGISKVSRSTMTTGMAYGTPSYMSPEQAQAKPVDGRSDVYSLGVVLFECMTGRVPFEGDDAFAVALKHVNQQPVPPNQIDPTLPGNVCRCILTSMAKDPESRFQTCKDFRNALGGHWPEYLLHGTGAVDRLQSFLNEIFLDRTFLPGMTFISFLISLLIQQQIPESPLGKHLVGTVMLPGPEKVSPLVSVPVMEEPPPAVMFDVDAALQQVALVIAARRYEEAERLLGRIQQVSKDHPQVAEFEVEIRLVKEVQQLRDEVDIHLEAKEWDEAMQKLSRLSLLNPNDQLIRKLYDDVAHEKSRKEARQNKLLQLHRTKETGDIELLQQQAEQFLISYPGDEDGMLILKQAKQTLMVQARNQSVRDNLQEALRFYEAGDLQNANRKNLRILQIVPEHPEALHLQNLIQTRKQEADQLKTMASEEEAVRRFLEDLTQSFVNRDLEAYLSLWLRKDPLKLQVESESIRNLFSLTNKIASSYSVLKIIIENEKAIVSMNWKTDVVFPEQEEFISLFNRQVQFHLLKEQGLWRIGDLSWLE